MTDTLRFGPEWLRQLSSGGSMTSPPPSPSFGGKYKLAEYRYGREEMLALFSPTPKAPDDLRQFTAILVESCQDPMAMIPQTEEERRLLASSVNSTAVFRQVMGRGGSSERGPPGMRGTGRGGMSTRGRGRGRGEGSGFYQRTGFEDTSSGRGEMFRGNRGSRDGLPTKVIERDSSGFLSARSFDEATDRRAKDPFSRSVPGDRWSELRGGRDQGNGRTDTEDTQTDDNDGDWRRAGKDRHARGGWRDAKQSFDEDPRYHRGFNRQISFERRNNSHSHHRADEAGDELPEWATDDMGGGDEGGTFDASGAFLSLKDMENDGPPLENGDKSKKHTTNKDTKLLETSPTEKRDDKDSSKQLKTTETHNANNVVTNSTNTPNSNKTDPSKTDSPQATTSVTVASSQDKKDSPLLDNSKKQQSASVENEADADFDHLTKAAEQMMANWAAEDDDNMPPANEEGADSWYYKDPQGTLQGPFSAQEMAEWFSAGYFTMNLLVKQGRDSTFQPLGEIIKRSGGRQPFLPGASISVNMMNPLTADPLLMTESMQQTYLLPQAQQLLMLQRQQQQQQQQQRQQQQLYVQQMRLQQILTQLKSMEKYSHLSLQQLQTLATQVLLEGQHKQALLNQHSMNSGRQSSPPRMSAGASQVPSSPVIQPDEDLLWGATNLSWKRQLSNQTPEELAQKEATRRLELQRLEELDRQREEMERAKREYEEKQRQLELDRQEIERQKKQRELERQQELDKQRELERLREVEKQRELERLKEIERQRELERQELERQRELEHQKELERQKEMERQERERQREAELRRERERQLEIQKQKEAEEKLRKEAERAEQERLERERQAEKERLEALQLPSTAQWASTNPLSGLTTQQSLHEIQKKEREQEEKERAARQLLEQKQKQIELEQSNQAQLKWASVSNPAPVTTGKSLREIQEEEARRLEKEMKEKNKSKATLAVNASLGTAASWGSKAATGWASEGAWGNAVKKAGWEQPAHNNRPKPVSNEVFPSLSAATTTATTTQTKGQNATQQKKKKQQQTPNNSKKTTSPNEKVQKLFQSQISSQSADDSFIEWCTKSLNGLNASIDVPTFVSFLREEPPYEVQDYVKSYLGDNPRAAQFAKEFLERRSTVNKKKQAQSRHDDEESLWGPAPAINPNVQRTDQSNKPSEKKKKSSKRSKPQKCDAMDLLGFTVGASSSRLNVGEIEKVE